MNKSRKIFILIIIITLSIGCFLFKNTSNVKTLNKQNLNSEKILYKDYYEMISLFTSDDFEGRLPGSTGNKKAEEMIENKFSSFDLIPFINDKYLQEYKQNTFKNINASMNIFLPDGKLKKLYYGRDFLDRKVILNLNIRSSITNNIDNLNENTKFLLANDNVNLSTYMQSNVPEDTIILVKSNNFMKLTHISDKYPIIQITDSVYDLLSNNNCEIQVTLSSVEENIVVNNISGMIEGINNNNALVISCHFDHIGTWGESIFRGAIDNASGTSILLNLTKDLSEFFKTTKPTYDIIFAAFNGEENGLQGSDFFVKNLSNKYNNIYNINLDCIGIKGDDTLVLSGDNSINMLNSLKSLFENEGIKVNTIDGGFNSDHMSFTNAGFYGINVGQYSIESIHTTDDTIDKLDFEYINNIKNTLYKIVTTELSELINDNKVIKTAMSPKDELAHKRTEECTRIKSSLALGEYGVFDILGCKYFIEKNSITYDSFNEFKSLFPNLILDQSICNYTLKEISIDYYSSFDKDNIIAFIQDLELNKIHSIDSTNPIVIKNFILKYYTPKEDYYIEILLNEGAFDSIDMDNSKIFTLNGSNYILTYSDNTLNSLFFIRKNLAINSSDYTLSVQIGKPVIGASTKLKELAFPISSSIQEEIFQLLENLEFSKIVNSVFYN